MKRPSAGHHNTMNRMAEPYLWPAEDDDSNDDEEFQNALSITIRQHLVSVAAGAFQDFLRLQQVHLPLGLQMIGLEAFKGCLALTDVNFPSSLIQIQDEAFEGCLSLQRAIFVDGLQLLGSDVFSGCKALKTAILPGTLEFLGTGAFLRCYSLSHVEMHKCTKLQVIPKQAFENCWALTHVQLPKSIQVIEESAFMKCFRLASVELPKGLEAIRTKAFCDCITLVSLELPEGLEELEEFSLSSCTSMQNLRLLQPDYFFAATARGQEDNDADADDDVSVDGLSPQGWDRLLEVFPNQSAIQKALYNRFDDFPLHKLCYHQIHYDSEDELMEAFDSIQVKPDISGSQADLLGMTPLHILALSVKPNTGNLFAKILEKYPFELVFKKDAWGMTCLDYLTRNKTPNPKPPLLQSASKLMNHVKFRGRRNKIEELLEQDLESNPIKQLGFLHKVFFQMAASQWLENLFTLELALWKAALNHHQRHTNSKRIKMDRQEVRISYGFYEVVFWNVLQFLKVITE